MSLESLRAERKELRDDKSKLIDLRVALSALKGDISDLAKVFKECSESIEHAGQINGKPFDEGKTGTYAGEMENTAASIESAIVAINGDITKIDQRLYFIDIEIDRELARLSNANNSTGSRTPTNNKNVRPSKILINMVE